jgi:hypothetical protein
MRRRRRHFDDEFDASYSSPTASTASTAELDGRDGTDLDDPRAGPRGWAHGDLSAYNLLVDDGRLVLIDLPQVVDVVGDPQGPEFLTRDVRRITEWFTARGLPGSGTTETLLGDLREEAGIAP